MLVFFRYTSIWLVFVLWLYVRCPISGADLGEGLGYLACPRSRLIVLIISGAVFISLIGLKVPWARIFVLNTACFYGISSVLRGWYQWCFNLINCFTGLAGSTVPAALVIIAHQAWLTDHRGSLFIIATAICLCIHNCRYFLLLILLIMS